MLSNARMNTTPPAPRELRDIAIDLFELTGLSQRDVATRAGVHRPNLSTWLSGKPHQLSEANQFAVLDVLGWNYGRLATGCVHVWQVGQVFDVATRVLRAEAAAGAKVGIVKVVGCSAAQGAAAVLIADAHRVQRLVVIRRTPAALPPEPSEVDANVLGVGATLRAEWLVDRREWNEIQTEPFESVLDLLPHVAFLELLGAPTLSQMEFDDEAFIDWDFELNTMLSNWTEQEREDWIALLSALRNSRLSPGSIARKLGVAMRSSRRPF